MASLTDVTQENTVSDKRIGYVCPFCRMVFATPSGLGGNGVICPGCEQLLTVPSRADGVSVLSTSKAKYKPAETKEADPRLVKRHRSADEDERHEREDGESAEIDKGGKMIIPVVISLLSIIMLGGLGYFLLSGNSERPVLEDEVSVKSMNDDVSEKGSDAQDFNTSKEVLYEYDSDDEEQVAFLEEYLTGFFKAVTVDEMLPYVIPVENIRDKMIKYYKGEAVSKSPFKKLLSAINTPNYPGYVSFSSQTQDYDTHIGVLKYARDQILIDWESYVGYSEMTWKELAEKKPTNSVKVRVTAKRAFYYNDDFIDESKWQAVSLVSPNEENSIYGYVKKGSAEAQRLFNFGLSDNSKVVLSIHFPANAKTGNQVIIDGVAAEGWVIKEEK